MLIWQNTQEKKTVCTCKDSGKTFPHSLQNNKMEVHQSLFSRELFQGKTDINVLREQLTGSKKLSSLYKYQLLTKRLIPYLPIQKKISFVFSVLTLGFLGALSRLQPEIIWNYDYGSYKGYIAESFVAQELISSGFSKLYGWKQGEAEIEFLLEQDESIHTCRSKIRMDHKSKKPAIF